MCASIPGVFKVPVQNLDHMILKLRVRLRNERTLNLCVLNDSNRVDKAQRLHWNIYADRGMFESVQV
jgi:hypothetical protein